MVNGARWAVLAALAAATVAWAQAPAPADAGEARRAAESPAKDPLALERLRQQAAAVRATLAPLDRVAPPPRDDARLAQMPRQRLTPAQVPGYVAAVHTKVLQALTADQRAAVLSLVTRVRREATPGSDVPRVLADAGTLAWILRQSVVATVLLGQAAIDAPADPQTLSNYAAALTTVGLADLGIPLLLRLDADAPDNSTVLNNLGQAWFSLGAVEEAKKALLLAIAAFPRHAEANETLSHILESEGDAAGAAQALQGSIEGAYTQRKVKRLSRMGRTVPRVRLVGHLPVPNDPLGLGRFEAPEFCQSLADLPACRERIAHHRRTVEAAIARIDRQLADESAPSAAAFEAPERPGQKVTVLPFKAAAGARLQWLEEEFSQRPVFANPAFQELVEQMRRKAEPVDEAFGKRAKHDPCGATADSLAYNNHALREFFATTRPVTQRFVNEKAYLAQFNQSPRQEASTRLLYQRSFLTFFLSIHGSVSTLGCDQQPAPPFVRLKPLADFYDMQCPNIITFNVPGIGGWTVRCNKMTAELDVKLPEIGPLPSIGLRASRSDNLDTGVMERGTLELATKAGLEKASAGPLDAKLEATAGVFVTFDGPEIDAGLRGGLQGSLKTGDLSVAKAGGEVTISINNGITAGVKR
jgi:tetratricopeptide (TPR) repeat protein